MHAFLNVLLKMIHSFIWQVFKWRDITNLASHNLIMEIMQNLFICDSYISCTTIMHWKHIWHTDLHEDEKFVHDIHSFIGSYFIHQHIYPCFKCVFNTWYSCVKCINLQMNEFCMTFIINLLLVKLWWMQIGVVRNRKSQTHLKVSLEWKSTWIIGPYNL